MGVFHDNLFKSPFSLTCSHPVSEGFFSTHVDTQPGSVQNMDHCHRLSTGSSGHVPDVPVCLLLLLLLSPPPLLPLLLLFSVCECDLCPVSQHQLILRQPGQRRLRRQEDLSRAAKPPNPVPYPLKPSAPNHPLLPFQGERGSALWHQQLRAAVSNWAAGLQCWFCRIAVHGKCYGFASSDPSSHLTSSCSYDRSARNKDKVEKKNNKKRQGSPLL